MFVHALNVVSDRLEVLILRIYTPYTISIIISVSNILLFITRFLHLLASYLHVRLYVCRRAIPKLRLTIFLIATVLGPLLM